MSFPNFKDNKRLFQNKNNNWWYWYIYKIWIFALVIFVFYVSSSRFIYARNVVWKNIKNNFLGSAAAVVSNSIWTIAKTDIHGNVNILLVWVWGEWHQWAYNTDTMIVASFSPDNKSLTFLSIPRDLYVKISENYAGRINATLPYHMSKTKDIDASLWLLRDKISEMIWLDIPYYAIVDFGWFKKSIDILGGLPINVPTALDDPTYPDDNERADQWGWWVHHLHIESGYQLLDWPTALKYARSRHSTSDFDRSSRQQAVISAVIDRLVSTNGIANIWKLYDQFKESVVTNFTNKEIIWLAKYINDIKNKTSFTMPSDCPRSLISMIPWCLLYSPDRSEFDGAAVLLPEWAKSNSVSNYKSIQKFASIIFWSPLSTKTDIYIANAVDKKFAAKHWWSNWLWMQVGVDLKKYWFNIVDSINSEIKTNANYIISLGSGDNSQTISNIQKFITWEVVDFNYFMSLSESGVLISSWSTGFEWFDELRKEMQNMSGSIWSGQNIPPNINNISDLKNATWWVLVIIWNQYLIDN